MNEYYNDDIQVVSRIPTTISNEIQHQIPTSESNIQILDSEPKISTVTGGTGGGIGAFWASFVQKLTHWDYIIVWGALLILSILLIVMVYIGSESTFYMNLVKQAINPWYIAGLWIFGTILSYIGFIFIWEDINDKTPQDLILSIYFVITDFIFIGWAAALYFAENIAFSYWMALFLFVFNFWLFLYIWRINIITAIFLIPNLVLYIYLIYSSLDLAYLNHVLI